MTIDLTFKSICTTLKKQSNGDTKLLKSVDDLLGIAIICSPVVLGPAAAAFLPTLSVKNELIKIGKSVFNKLIKKKHEDYLVHHETMQTAYGLLVFTSFFAALDSRLSGTLRKEIGLLDSERAFLAKDGVKKTSGLKPSEQLFEIDEAPAATLSLAFPHPTETLAEQSQRHAKLWKQMSQSFLEFVQKLAFWEQADEKKQTSLLAGLDKVEQDAAKHFEAQYLELARKFEDFAIWANLQAHKEAKALIGQLSDYVKQHGELSAATGKSIDVGFTKLRQVVLSIPETLRVEQASEISESFNKHYQARINEPIIEDKDIGKENTPRLLFPKKSDAFVPQSFRVLRQAPQSRRLEEEVTWNALPRRDDLGPFLLSYLSSPYSNEAPLLILGHPGSGKSLLTTILAAQLMSKQFTAIRVPLREVNADADVQAQIEEFIKRVSGISFDSWIKLRSLFKNCPPVVILDGYDELLQASGQVFASYIMEAQRFQQHQAEQGWPVRIIITSRITLIDKAAVPVGSTIVRLLEFDSHQRDCWSSIWNKANSSYFREAGIEKFVLPSETEKGAEKILSLAEQPLLLLMLALFDSQANELRTSKGLDRTKLYDSLIRRFVIRERSKEKGFNDAKAKEREKALAIEMQRLGVAALGMYNRRKVHILSDELDEDLAFFKLERESVAKTGKALSQADLLLGSFFFVHKSKAQHSSGADVTHEESSAFEFLHNTFGEFLTADFIVRRAVGQVQALRAAEANELLRSVMDKMLGTADGLERDWFASFVYTPLSTRPVILDMIREWAPQVLKEHLLSEEDFVETLGKIVLNQIKRVLSKREMPQIMRKETAQEGYRVPFGDHPLLGHIAIYSINLVLFRLVTGKSPFIFDEGEITSHEDGTRPWDRLIHIWRSWFSLENLNSLTAVMVADRSGSRIQVSAKSRFQAEEAKGALNDFFNIAVALGDNVSAGMAGVYLFDPKIGSIDALTKLEDRLSSEGFDVGAATSVIRLLALVQKSEKVSEEFVYYARRALEQATTDGRRDQIEVICAIITRTLDQRRRSRSARSNPYRLFRDAYHPDLVTKVAEHDPRSARNILNLAGRLGDREWILEFSHIVHETFLHRISSLEHGRLPQRDAEEWLLLLQDIRRRGGARSFNGRGLRRMRSPEFVERMVQPEHLLELSERNLEAGLTYFQSLRELMGVRDFAELMRRRVGPELIDHLLHPRHLFELCERDAEGALAYLRLLRELIGGRDFEELLRRRIDPKFIDHLFQPHYFLEIGDRDPEGALVHLRLLREFIGIDELKESFRRNIDRELIDRLFHPHFLSKLIEHNPEGALTYLGLLREVIGGHDFEELLRSRIDPEFIDRLFNPRHLLELSKRNPEGALAYLRLMRELIGGGVRKELFRQGVDPKLIERMLSEVAMNPDGVKVHTLGAWLAISRLFDSGMASNVVGQSLVDLLIRRPALKSQLSTLPISSLSDLRWLADKSGSAELQSFVDELAA